MPLPFLMALIATGLFAWFVRESCMAVVVGVLTLNWLLCVALAAVGDGSGTDYFGMGVIDGCSAAMILLFGHRPWQLIVAGIYVVMIAAHVLRWAVPLTDHDYLSTLSVLAWGQLAMALGRGLYVVNRRDEGGNTSDHRLLPDVRLDNQDKGGA